VSLPKFTLPAREPFPANVIALIGGLPDVRLFRRDLLARAYRRVLSRGVQTLGYGSEYGEPRLLRALTAHLSSARGVLAAAGELLVTRGSQMAFPLLARALCEPGDVIAVEALGYPPAWEGFRLGGAELRAVPLDRAGIRLDRLQELACRSRLRAVYVTPHHQYPTAVTMSAPRRQGLLALAERHGFFVIEDDYDHEFHWSGRPVLPLASADPARLVIHVGTLSKLLAPGLRVGYVSARAEVVERLARLRMFIDRQGDQTLEAALAEWLDDGEFDRHTKRARRAYAERRDALAAALEQHFAEGLEFELPAGGLSFWARSRLGMPVERLAELALERGVLIHPARRFAFDRRPREFLRLGFPGHTPSEIQKGVGVLAAIVKASAA
jgi:GntR family transcriptional regulator/MocR family aminotransferase